MISVHGHLAPLLLGPCKAEHHGGSTQWSLDSAHGIQEAERVRGLGKEVPFSDRLLQGDPTHLQSVHHCSIIPSKCDVITFNTRAFGGCFLSGAELTLSPRPLPILSVLISHQSRGMRVAYLQPWLPAAKETWPCGLTGTPGTGHLSLTCPRLGPAGSWLGGGLGPPWLGPVLLDGSSTQRGQTITFPVLELSAAAACPWPCSLPRDSASPTGTLCCSLLREAMPDSSILCFPLPLA
jgi:hypothetical protein